MAITTTPSADGNLARSLRSVKSEPNSDSLTKLVLVTSLILAPIACHVLTDMTGPAANIPEYVLLLIGTYAWTVAAVGTATIVTCMARKAIRGVFRLS